MYWESDLALPDEAGEITIEQDIVTFHNGEYHLRFGPHIFRLEARGNTNYDNQRRAWIRKPGMVRELFVYIKGKFTIRGFVP